MPPNTYDPAPTPANSAYRDHACPKCGVEMEPIDIVVDGLKGADGLPLQHLQLCPGCYLVTWSDQAGIHVRQGVPMKKGFDPRGEPRLGREPEEC